MTSRISGIFPLLLITLFCIGLVEGGYLLFEHFILKTFENTKINEAILKTNPANKTTDTRKNDYRIIAQRNLFGPPSDSEKSLILPLPGHKRALSATTLEIVLMGTIIGNSGIERAIIMDKKNFKQNLYKKGDAVQGALVKEVSRGKVILSYNGKDEMLDMSEAANVRFPAKAQPAANLLSIGLGQSNTPLRVVVPQSVNTNDPGTVALEGQVLPDPIAPGTPTAKTSAPVVEQPVNVERVMKTLIPQKVYRSSQQTNKQ